MAHLTRSRRAANNRRRELAAQKQRPLPLEEQQKRAAERLAAHQAEYPVPPTYSDAYNRKPRSQPRCYDPVPMIDPFLAVIQQIMAARMARGAHRAKAKKAAA